MLRVELIAQRPRVVVVDEQEASRGNSMVGGEDRLMVLRRGQRADVETGICPWRLPGPGCGGPGRPAARPGARLPRQPV
jgi:hypothetical protein